MKIVIDIPKETFKYYVTLANKKGEQINNLLERIILDGTPLPEQQQKTRKDLEHTNDIPAASIGDVGYTSIVGQPVTVLDKNRWGIICNVSSYGSSTYLTIVYPDCKIESVNSNNVILDLYHGGVGKRDASDYENLIAVREWVRARMNDKFGAPKEESEE